MTYNGSLRSLASVRFAPFRSFTSLAGFLYRGVQEFWLREEHYYNYSDIDIFLGKVKHFCCLGNNKIENLKK